jgi:hypothetical protein
VRFAPGHTLAANAEAPARAPIREATGGVDERVRQARLLYERAVFGGDDGPLADADRELDAVEADLAVARGSGPGASTRLSGAITPVPGPSLSVRWNWHPGQATR